MTQSEFVDRTGLSPVEVWARWREILRAYHGNNHDRDIPCGLRWLCADHEHKNLFCLKWLKEQRRDLTQCVDFVKEHTPDLLIDFRKWLAVTDLAFARKFSC